MRKITYVCACTANKTRVGRNYSTHSWPRTLGMILSTHLCGAYSQSYTYLDCTSSQGLYQDSDIWFITGALYDNYLWYLFYPSIVRSGTPCMYSCSAEVLKYNLGCEAHWNIILHVLLFFLIESEASRSCLRRVSSPMGSTATHECNWCLCSWFSMQRNTKYQVENKVLKSKHGVITFYCQHVSSAQDFLNTCSTIY